MTSSAHLFKRRNNFIFDVIYVLKTNRIPTEKTYVDLKCIIDNNENIQMRQRIQYKISFSDACFQVKRN